MNVLNKNIKNKSIKFMTPFIALLLALFSLSSFSSLANNNFSCLHITKTGKGPIVFLIPGFSNDSRVWHDTTQFLAKDFEVHNISLAGFGSNPPCADSNNIYDAALNQIQQYAEKNDLKNISIIGHSMGGLLSMNLAITASDRITRVASVDGLPFIGPIFTRTNSTTPQDLAAQANQIAQFYKNATPEQISDMTERGLFVQTDNSLGQQQILEMASHSDPATLGSAILSVMTTDLRTRMNTIDASLLMIGASGGFQNEEQKRSVQQLYQQQFETLPNARVEMNTKSKHFVMYDDGIWLNKTIKQFLTRMENVENL